MSFKVYYNSYQNYRCFLSLNNMILKQNTWVVCDKITLNKWICNIYITHVNL